MSVTCEFELQSADLPLCAVAAELDTRLIVDNVVAGTTGEPALVFSATGGDPDALESALLGDEAVVEFVAMDSAIGESRYRVGPDTDYVEMYTQLVDQQTYPMGSLVTEHGRPPCDQTLPEARCPRRRRSCLVSPR